MNQIQTQPSEIDGVPSGQPNYRGLPSLEFLKAFFKRNVLLAAFVGAVYSPIALLLLLNVTNEYTSGVVLKYDPTDAIDPEMEPGAGFPAMIAALTVPATGEEFFLELARRFQSNSPPFDLSQLPIVGPHLKRFQSEKPVEMSPLDLRNQALQLQKSISFFSDYERRTANIGVLTAIAGSPEAAQGLASAAANLLIDMYYGFQTTRLEAITHILTSLLQKDQVKEMVERAVNAAQKANSPKHPQAKKDNGVELRMRQNAVQEQIKDLTLRLQEERDRKIKIETEIMNLAQRYGPYHPQIKALQSQLAEINSTSKQKQMAADLSRLQDQFVSYEAEAAALGVSGREDLEETVDKVVQRLGLRLDRYNLELISVKAQRDDPARRVRLQMVGTPPLPLDATKRGKPKMAGILAGVGLALMMVTVLGRELVGGKARDPWTISWLLQLPCLATLPRSVQRSLGSLSPDRVRSLRAQLLGSKAEARRARPLLSLRQLGHWLRTKTSGDVILLVKSTSQASCSEFLHNLANVYACDYPGRLLVIDLDGRDPMPLRLAADADASILDYLDRRLPWKRICQPRDGDRAYDLVPAPSPRDLRTPELLGSTGFSEFMNSALKIYQTVFVIGFGPEQFVENAALMAQANACVLIVESPATSFSQIIKLAEHLKGDKLVGYVHLER